MTRGRPPREDRRRYVRIGVQLTPDEEDEITKVLTPDERRDALMRAVRAREYANVLHDTV